MEICVFLVMLTFIVIIPVLSLHYKFAAAENIEFVNTNFVPPPHSKPKYANCPNCGAPMYNNKCDYCGSEF